MIPDEYGVEIRQLAILDAPEAVGIVILVSKQLSAFSLENVTVVGASQTRAIPAAVRSSNVQLAKNANSGPENDVAPIPLGMAEDTTAPRKVVGAVMLYVCDNSTRPLIIAALRYRDQSEADPITNHSGRAAQGNDSEEGAFPVIKPYNGISANRPIVSDGAG